MPSVALPSAQPPPELPERPEGAAPEGRARTGNERWRPWTAFAALFCGLVAALIGGVIIAGVASAAGSDPRHLPPGAVLAATLVQDVGFIVSAVAFATLAGRTSAAQFGLRLPGRPGRAALILVGVYLVYLLFTGIWSQLVHIDDPTNQLDTLGARDSTPALVGALLIVCVGAPLVEEFLFRGYVFTTLRNWRGVVPAALITGVMFGAIHAGGSPVGALLPLAVLGVGLCLLYAWTGSLFPCVALHAINNSIAFGASMHWGAGIVAVVAGALTACALVLVPVARRWTGPPPSGPAVLPSPAGPPAPVA